MRNFSIVIATYTGVDTISKTFESLLAQEAPHAKYEIIVVIDGPNQTLRQKVNDYQEKFEKTGIPFKIKQFSKNRGRFEARLEASRIAGYNYILIVDDRVELPNNYLRFMSGLDEEAIMPDVEEGRADNVISLTLGRIRAKVYGKQWGGKFKPFYIDTHNFDRSAKGTGTFWVGRKNFIDACQSVAKALKSTKSSSDDTRLLKYIVDSGIKIYKTAEVRVKYNSRSSGWSEFKHIFQRGPKFIDYYLRPGRRFFPLLVAFYVLLIPVIALLVIYPFIILVILGFSLLAGAGVAGRLNDLFKVWAGLWLVFLGFGAGLVWGLVKKAWD